MKIEFTSTAEMLEWLAGRESKYEIYIAKETNEIVAMPMVSTRPIKIGISPYKENINTISETIKKALPDLEGRLYIVNTVDYNIAER